MDDDAREVARQRRIAEACAGDTGATGRLGLYRRLIQGNLASVARRLLPRTSSALDAATGGAFDAWFARFLADVGPRTPYLRDVPAEFVAWASPRWAADASLPLFVPDLGRFEMDRFAVEWAPSEVAARLGEVLPDRPLVFAAPRRLTTYAHAVHEDGTPSPRDTALLIHRDDDHTVHVSAVDPSRASLLARLLAGAPVAEATLALGPAALAVFLASLGESGALLGGRAD